MSKAAGELSSKESRDSCIGRDEIVTHWKADCRVLIEELKERQSN